MDDANLAFIHYFLRKKEAEDRAWLAGELPRVIGQGVGTHWTYQTAYQSNASEKLEVCASEDCDSQQRELGSNDAGDTVLVCSKCHTPWPVHRKSGGRKPSEMIIPLAMMVAVASRAKNVQQVYQWIKSSLGPPIQDWGGEGLAQSEMSQAYPGAQMMDSAHSTPERFKELIRKADIETAKTVEEKAENVFDKMDAAFTGPSSADQSGDSPESD